ncbi:hypothetical protein [Priestia sp. LL-8]|uniref:hypothetical protein n=1 Tax=Priestia sp. LL-8 TaxID=3110068 RepID=UPI002E256B92|nr:hypothetical protein [Priestia sp. LL-8]
MDLDIYTNVEQLLSKKKYEQAFLMMKLYIEKLIVNSGFSEKNFLQEVKGKKILINTTNDAKRKRLFCTPLINYLKLKNLHNLNEYLEQCEYINGEFESLNLDINDFLTRLKKDNQTIALFKILSTFENINHTILNNEKKNPYIIFNHVGSESEALYENNIEALNILIEKWASMCKEGLFSKKAHKEKDIEKLKPLSINEKMWQKNVSLKFLYWLINEVTLNKMVVKREENKVRFIYTDKDEYIRYRLPFIRESFLNKKFTYNLMNKKKNAKQIDYGKVLELKRGGEHFSLRLTPQIIYENMENSINVGYSEYIKIATLLKVQGYSELEYNNVNIEEAFIFYYCLRNMATIYYEATEYFIKKYGKFPKAPFLCVSIKSLHEQLSYMLSKVFKRNIELDDINKWVRFFSFGEDKINDLYYKPLIKNKESIIIIPSLFLMNNMYMTFTRHLQMLQINLSNKGTLFEQAVRRLFINSGFVTYGDNYTFNYYSTSCGQEVKGDIDIIAHKGSHLFIAEVKNHLDPVEPEDYRSGNKVIKKANSQISKILRYIEEKTDEFCERVGINIEELNRLKIVPFIVISGYYRSGEKINGIPITDYNSLEKFIEDGELTIQAGEDILAKVPIRNAKMTTTDLINFLEEPYFYGLNGCYAPMLYVANTMQMSSKELFVSPDLPDLEKEKYKYSILFPNEDEMREVLGEPAGESKR